MLSTLETRSTSRRAQVHPDGTRKWTYLTGDDVISSPAIGARPRPTALRSQLTSATSDDSLTSRATPETTLGSRQRLQARTTRRSTSSVSTGGSTRFVRRTAPKCGPSTSATESRANRSSTPRRSSTSARDRVELNSSTTLQFEVFRTGVAIGDVSPSRTRREMIDREDPRLLGRGSLRGAREHQTFGGRARLTV